MKKYRVGLAFILACIIMLVPVSVGATLINDYDYQHQKSYTTYGITVRGFISKSDDVYATAHDAVNGDGVSTSVLGIGQYYTGASPHYGVQRTYLIFDTSPIPDGATIDTATLKLYGTSDWSYTDFNIVVSSGMPVYPHNPIVVGDYDDDNYAGDGGSLSTASWSVGAYNDITLNATGEGWVNKTGYTKFLLRSSRDISGTTPTGYEFVWAASSLTTNPVQLVVTYEITAPAVTANAASNIAATTARLNSTVDDDGGEPCDIRFGYGKVSHVVGDFNLYTTITDWVEDTYTTGQHPYVDVASLDVADTYYYRVQIRNDDSTVTSTDEITFDTIAAVSEPTNLKAKPSATETVIDLSWSKGSGATETMVRVGYTTYPTTTGEGTLVYLGTASSTVHEDITGGKIYYYSAWGKSGASYSAAYDTVMVTASALAAIYDDLETPGLIARLFGAPNYENLENIPVLYDAINAIADSIEMPRASMWFILAILFSVCGAILAFLLSDGNFVVALIVLTLLLTGGWASQVVPFWIPLVTLVVTIAMHFTRREATA